MMKEMARRVAMMMAWMLLVTSMWACSSYRTVRITKDPSHKSDVADEKVVKLALTSVQLKLLTDQDHKGMALVSFSGLENPDSHLQQIWFSGAMSLKNITLDPDIQSGLTTLYRGPDGSFHRMILALPQKSHREGVIALLNGSSSFFQTSGLPFTPTGK
jgi:hypothetical protein